MLGKHADGGSPGALDPAEGSAAAALLATYEEKT
jgi:hypothetical protein